jgi:hypothetical protein
MIAETAGLVRPDAGGWHKAALLILLVFASLRLLWLDALLQEPEHDSWAYTIEAKKVGEQGVGAYLGGVVRRSPLFPLIAGLPVKAGLSPFLSAKLTANAFYLGTLLGTYALARLLFGMEAGLFAAALFALDSVMVNFGVKPFIDMGMACLMTWSLVAMVSLVRHPRARSGLLLGACLLAATFMRPEGGVFSTAVLLAVLVGAFRSGSLSRPVSWIAVGTYLAGFALAAAFLPTGGWSGKGLGGHLLLESTVAYRLSPGSTEAGHWPAVDAVAREYPQGGYPSMARILLEDPSLHLRRLTRNVGLYLRGVVNHLHFLLAGLLLAGLICGLVKNPRFVPAALAVAAFLMLFAAPYIFLSAVDERLALASYPQVYVLASLGITSLAGLRRASLVLVMLVLMFAGLRHARYLQSSWQEKYTQEGYPPVLSAWTAIAPEIQGQVRVVIFGPVWNLYLPREANLRELWRFDGLPALKEIVEADRPRFLLLGGGYHESEEIHDFFRRSPSPGQLGPAQLIQVYPRQPGPTDVRVFELSYPTVKGKPR